MLVLSPLHSPPTLGQYWFQQKQMRVVEGNLDMEISPGYLFFLSS
jgi:hypothetical protein